jgi:hypothetical protein
MAEVYEKGKKYEGNRLKVEDIIKRAEVAQRKKDLFEDLYRDAYEFALPQRQLYGYWEGNSQGNKKMGSGVRLHGHQLDPAFCQPTAVGNLPPAA